MSENTISEARLNANRDNAQKSSGPVTSEGKSKVRLNAVKHSLTSTSILFVNEAEAARYVCHVEDYKTLYRPIGPEECALVQSIADTRWRLNKIPALEQTLLAGACAALIDVSPEWANPSNDLALEIEARRIHERDLRNLHLQESRLTRRREREVAELERLQTARKANEAEALAEAAKATILADHRQETLYPIPGVGFDFSKARYESYMSSLTPAQKQKFLQEALGTAAETARTKGAAA